jgi:hypothetical protein
MYDSAMYSSVGSVLVMMMRQKGTDFEQQKLAQPPVEQTRPAGSALKQHRHSHNSPKALIKKHCLVEPKSLSLNLKHFHYHTINNNKE